MRSRLFETTHAHRDDAETGQELGFELVVATEAVDRRARVLPDAEPLFITCSSPTDLKHELYPNARDVIVVLAALRGIERLVKGTLCRLGVDHLALELREDRQSLCVERPIPQGSGVLDDDLGALQPRFVLPHLDERAKLR